MRHAASPGAAIALLRMNSQIDGCGTFCRRFASRRSSCIAATLASATAPPRGARPGRIRSPRPKRRPTWQSEIPTARARRAARRRPPALDRRHRPAARGGGGVPDGSPHCGPEPDRVLATILFTDIVGSTAIAARVGDGRWRDLVGRHNALVGRGRSGSAGTRSTPPATGSWRRLTDRRREYAARAQLRNR